MTQDDWDDVRNLLIVAAVAVMAMWLCGCTRQVPVVVERVRTEYREADTTAIYDRVSRRMEAEWRRDMAMDSVVDRMKETVVLNERGDTTRYDREREVYRRSKRETELERDVRQRDSIIAALRTEMAAEKGDSIPVPVVVEVERNSWCKGFSIFKDLGWRVVLCVAVVWLIRRLVPRRR